MLSRAEVGRNKSCSPSGLAGVHSVGQYTKAMRKTHLLVRTALLMALALGMNLLSYVDIAHGRRAPHSSRISYSHVPPHGSHRPTGRSGRTLRLAAADNHAPEVAEATVIPKMKPIDPVVVTPAIALAYQGPILQPEMLSEPLAQVNEIAAGSAPRAPGGSRAPPIA